MSFISTNRNTDSVIGRQISAKKYFEIMEFYIPLIGSCLESPFLPDWLILKLSNLFVHVSFSKYCFDERIMHPTGKLIIAWDPLEEIC